MGTRTLGGSLTSVLTAIAIQMFPETGLHRARDREVGGIHGDLVGCVCG